MVAIIKPTQGVKGPLYYNEQKLAKGVASVIFANGFWKPAADLSFAEKKGCLDQLASLNDRAKFKGLHVTLNFDKSDKLSIEQLQAIAQDYMERIGFGNQPYLVYEHRDAHHPHLHIVTSTIQANRRAIRLYGIGKFKSEPARIQIEQDYGLTVAKGRRAFEQVLIPAVSIEKARYAENGTAAEIARVVSAVRSTYKFTTLPELKAALHQFGVHAENGPVGSKLRQQGGLLYSILDKYGKKTGVPIKASRLPGRPTLANLERQFNSGEKGRAFFRQRVITAVNSSLAKKQCTTFTAFEALLKPYGIVPVVVKNEADATDTILYLDNNKRCVFDGRFLSGTPQPAVIAVKLSAGENVNSNNPVLATTVQHPSSATGSTSSTSLHEEQSTQTTEQLTEALLGSNARYEAADPYRKKKKRKGRDHGLGR